MHINMEDHNIKMLNEKYLKKFIKKFWLQPIPEALAELPSDDDDDGAVSQPENCALAARKDPTNTTHGLHCHSVAAADFNQNFAAAATTTSLPSSVANGVYNKSPVNSAVQNSPFKMSSSALSAPAALAAPARTSSFQRSHRRLPSYANVDIIFLESRK